MMVTILVAVDGGGKFCKTVIKCIRCVGGLRVRATDGEQKPLLEMVDDRLFSLESGEILLRLLFRGSNMVLHQQL
jgi:hypothetical protein